MSILTRLAPTAVARAHCDLPCGVYDPEQARIEAESCHRINEKYAANEDATFRTRAIAIKADVGDEMQVQAMFRQAIASWQFKDAVDAGERLLPVVTSQRRWIGGDELRDGLVLAKLHLRDAAGAQRRFYQLAPLSTRKPADLRSQLLEAYVTTAAESQPKVAQK